MGRAQTGQAARSPGDLQREDAAGALGIGRGLVLSLGLASLAVRSTPSTHLLYQAVGVCFLLTSAGAVMLQLIAVHGLFAVSPLPANKRKRSPLAGVRLCCSALGVSPQILCPFGGSLRHLLGLGTGQLSL